MATIKKNVIAQVLFTMVDKTDFATIESALTSNFTVSLFGVNHGSFTAASDITVSRSISVVKSGIYKCELKAAETNWDFLMLKITHASAADQMIPIQTVTNDDEDLYSQLTGSSNMLSGMSDILSDCKVLAAGNSNILSNMSNVLSNTNTLVVGISDITSDIKALAASGATAAAVTDLSAVLSDFESNFSSRVPKLVANDSDLSNMHSDLRSMISGITATVSASDISDIASRVWSEKYHAHSAASSFGSLFSVVATQTAGASNMLSGASDILSDIKVLATAGATSAALSDVRSDLRSMISGITATVSASDISDIASRVWSEKYHAHSLASSFGSLFSVVATESNRTDSRVLVVQSSVSDVDSQVLLNASMISDIDSQLTVTHSLLSDVESQLDITASKVLLNQSMLSDIDSQLLLNASVISDVDSQVLLNASAISDIDSQLTITASKVLLIQSSLSDVESQLDLNASVISDIDSQLTVTHSLLSDVESQIDAGVQLASGQTATWASALEASAGTIKEGTAKAGTLSTTQMSTTMTEVDDVFNGRILIFKSDTTTAALRLQATDITDFANTNGVLTYTAVTTAPAATETFTIV